MARPPVAKDNEKTKTFHVAPGFIIGGFDGKKKVGGDPIELTRAQAVYYQKLGAITIDIPEFEDDEPSSGSAAEAGAGTETEGEGAASSGSASDSDAASEAKPSRRR